MDDNATEKSDPDTYTGTPKEELGGAPAQGRASGESEGRGERGDEGIPTGVMDQSQPVE